MPFEFPHPAAPSAEVLRLNGAVAVVSIQGLDLSSEAIDDTPKGSIQAQLRSAELLETTDGVDVQNATVRLFKQDASVRGKAPAELIDDYIEVLDESGRIPVDTIHVRPADDGQVVFRNLPLVDDGNAPIVYTIQIDGARSEVQTLNDPSSRRIVHFDEAAVPNLMAETGDPVPTREIRLIPFDGFEVNSIGDAPDLNELDGQCITGQLQTEARPECTLRAAIQQANAREGRDLISFNIPGESP